MSVAFGSTCLPFSIPEPHPLDFDWRYDSLTVARLKDVVSGKGLVLSLGAPSIARALEKIGQPVLLVDRQPCLGVRNHWPIEISSRTVLEASGANTSIVDPPWYPRDLLSWASVAGQAVGVGHTVFISVWPDNTRPSAAYEREEVKRELSSWSIVTEHKEILQYEMPRFEQEAIRLSGLTSLSSSPRVGSLLELKVTREPTVAASPMRRGNWMRYIVNDYQLAVRVSTSGTTGSRILPHPKAAGWKWPYVSARAPGIDEIGIWSSRGEVARMGNSEGIIHSLKAAFSSNSGEAFERALAAYPDLLAWDIPRPPYWRSLEWHHLD